MGRKHMCEVIEIRYCGQLRAIEVLWQISHMYQTFFKLSRISEFGAKATSSNATVLEERKTKAERTFHGEEAVV